MVFIFAEVALSYQFCNKSFDKQDAREINERKSIATRITLNVVCACSARGPGASPDAASGFHKHTVNQRHTGNPANQRQSGDQSDRMQ
jgi:hypothetical protein